MIVLSVYGAFKFPNQGNPRNTFIGRILGKRSFQKAYYAVEVSSFCQERSLTCIVPPRFDALSLKFLPPLFALQQSLPNIATS